MEFSLRIRINKWELFFLDSEKVLKFCFIWCNKKILRIVVTNEEGTAELANVKAYEVGGKTGTAEISKKGRYTRD